MTAIRHLRLVGEGRPVTRADCEPGGTYEARPCSFTTCEFHMANIRTRRAKVVAGAETCVLDVTEFGGATLQEIADALGCVRERARQLIEHGLETMRRRLGISREELEAQLRGLSEDRPKWGAVEAETMKKKTKKPQPKRTKPKTKKRSTPKPMTATPPPQPSSTEKTLVLRTCPMFDERATHGRFRHLRRIGEWFRAGPELLEYIAGLAQPEPG